MAVWLAGNRDTEDQKSLHWKQRQGRGSSLKEKRRRIIEVKKKNTATWSLFSSPAPLPLPASPCSSAREPLSFPSFAHTPSLTAMPLSSVSLENSYTSCEAPPLCHFP